MTRKAIAPLALLLTLALAGCSGQRDDRDGQAGAQSAASSSPSSPTTATTTASAVDATREVCQQVSLVTTSYLLAEGLAITSDQKNAALRNDVAAAYSDFALDLSRIANLALGASAELWAALTRWASVSTEVAEYVAETKPRRGIVVEYGPAQPRFDAAEKAVEKICGHPLPNTGS